MRLYGIVADVAAAILRGRVLHAEEEGEGEWGVIHTDRALDAFDASADGWCGRDGIPHRHTREEAETRARRLSGSSHDGTAYEALRLPSRPPRATVGPYHEAVGGLAFRCLDWTNGAGVPVAAWQVVPRIDERGLDHTTEDDPSAFGAALAFVRLVGERAACAAVYATSGVDA